MENLTIQSHCNWLKVTNLPYFIIIHSRYFSQLGHLVLRFVGKKKGNRIVTEIDMDIVKIEEKNLNEKNTITGSSLFLPPSFAAVVDWLLICNTSFSCKEKKNEDIKVPH